MGPKAYLIVASILFLTGVEGFLLRRNLVVLLMSLELMLNAANLVLITFARFYQGTLDGHVVVFLAMALAGAETALGLGIVVAVFRLRKTTNVDELAIMKG